MKRQLKSVAELDELVHVARSMYGEANTHAGDVETVFQGDWTVPEDIEDIDIIVTNPSTPRTLARKMQSMLAIRSDKRITVPPLDDSRGAYDKADLLERFLQGWLEEMQYQTQTDVIRGFCWWVLMRGRGIYKMSYDPVEDGMRVFCETPDPLTVFPMYSHRKLEWVVQEYNRQRWELEEWFSSIDKKKTKLDIPDMRHVGIGEDAVALPTDWIQVREYWDEKYHYMAIDTHWLGEMEHDYGFVPFVQGYMHWTPDERKRWAYASFLSDVLDDIKNDAILNSKMATGVEQFYYPRLYYWTEDGQLMRVDAHDDPGAFEPIHPDVKPLILNPTSNSEVLALFHNSVRQNIGKGTLSDIVFTQDIPNVSGFLVSQYLSLVKDQIADVLHGMETATSLMLSQALHLHEQMAPLQKGKAWAYPMLATKGSAKRKIEQVRQADIEGHERVRMTIRAALPQDILQMVTTMNQLGQADPATGKAIFDVLTRLKLSGLDELVEDMAEMENRRDWEYLLANDEPTAALNIEYIKSRFADRLDDMRESVEDMQDMERERAAKRAEQDLADGVQRDVVIPFGQQTPQLYHQLATAAEQGVHPDTVLNGLPLGAPNEQQGMAQMHPQGAGLSSDELTRLQNLMSGHAPLGGPRNPEQPPNTAGAQFESPLPDGLTGYEGISPQALPAPMQGAQPRQSVDQANLFVEDVEDERSPALPPRK